MLPPPCQNQSRGLTHLFKHLTFKSNLLFLLNLIVVTKILDFFTLLDDNPNLLNLLEGKAILFTFLEQISTSIFGFIESMR